MSDGPFGACGICGAVLSDRRALEYARAAEVASWWIGAALCEKCADDPSV